RFLHSAHGWAERPGAQGATWAAGGEPWAYRGPKASFDRFERAQDGQARSREDRKWRKEFEKSRQLLSDQIIATARA
ncbi:MAG: hypothetical protein EBZ48_07660, partial [Proteobacteria bacterium]|nr:hypothetical protein [Pseudomonadota bacterium]